ncbi:unnamed protein product [Knipowitschia caucasica]
MERYETLASVGEGSYGSVMKCRHKESGRLVAIKKFLDSDEDLAVKKIAQREVRLLRLLRHDNLVNLLDVWKRRRRWFLVFEFVERTLLDELELHPKGLELQTCRQLLFQILRATAFCHQQNVIHRDIKPENVLISQGGVVKLCDFGFARIVASEGGAYTDYVATRWYRPPELLVGDAHYGKPVDVWAIGCLLMEMLSGQPLFPGESDLDQIHHIVQCFGDLTRHHQQLFHSNPLFSGARLPQCPRPVPLSQRFPELCPWALGLAESCLRMEPELRPHCSELLEHQLFTHDSFNIRFSEELIAKIQKHHRENSTLPKIPKAQRAGRDDPEKDRRLQRLPENLDEKGRAKKDKDPPDDKTKGGRQAKLPKPHQNPPEASTKFAKNAAPHHNCPEKAAKAAKITEAKDNAPELSNKSNKTTAVIHNAPETYAKATKATGAHQTALEQSIKSTKSTAGKDMSLGTSNKQTKGTLPNQTAQEGSNKQMKGTLANQTAQEGSNKQTKAPLPNQTAQEGSNKQTKTIEFNKNASEIPSKVAKITGVDKNSPEMCPKVSQIAETTDYALGLSPGSQKTTETKDKALEMSPKPSKIIGTTEIALGMSTNTAEVVKISENPLDMSPKLFKTTGLKDNEEVSENPLKPNGTKENYSEMFLKPSTCGTKDDPLGLSKKSSKLIEGNNNTLEIPTKMAKITGANKYNLQMPLKMSKITGTMNNASNLSIKTTKITEATQNSSELSTKTSKTTEAKENVTKNALSIKPQLNNLMVKTKANRVPSPEHKHGNPSSKPSRVLQQEQKAVRSFVKKAAHVSEAQSITTSFNVLNSTGELVMLDVASDLQRSHSNVTHQLAKSRDEARNTAQNSEMERSSKSSQTLESCTSKKSDPSPNPNMSSQSLEESLSKLVDLKSVRLSSPAQNQSKISLQSLSKAPKHDQEDPNCLRIKALTCNFLLQRGARVASGNRSRHLKEDNSLLKGEELSQDLTFVSKGLKETLEQDSKMVAAWDSTMYSKNVPTQDTEMASLAVSTSHLLDPPTPPSDHAPYNTFR